LLLSNSVYYQLTDSQSIILNSVHLSLFLGPFYDFCHYFRFISLISLGRWKKKKG